MDREIKFRGKRVDNGEWVYFNQYGAYVDKSPKRFTRDCGYEVIPDTVGQFTGLRDKDGKEIYELDKLLLDDGTGQIVHFANGCFFAGEPLQNVVDVCAVIGNVFEEVKR